ncbi:malonyl-CoA O-methyltransferase [Persephonella hydrogeniphila]|uniref:Malonyl-CoA O-methyltransferase n=1 Tax=Persephonella hydrogeniphila TaxID=198703 RepID=A0A285NKX2_9AQUI|nr:methyltransferase domain-containing protein [Persephonella hydrogeniphila]SNZ09878.1 malonyl-CoA O-methyltransferase [Persephonella hydrogeniphila]
MKTLVKFSFSRFSESYDKEAVLQKEAAKILIEFAGRLKGKILDIGCGTGFLYRYSEWKNTVGIDIAEDMVRFYKKFNRSVILGDMEKLPFQENSFDNVVSNFSLHWADFGTTVSQVRHVLKKDGCFVFNIPVGGSLKAVEKILGDTTFDFLCVPEILDILRENGFRIEDFFVENLEKEFENGYELLMHLHKTGVAINTESKSIGEKRKIVQKFKENKTPVQLNFKLLFVKAYL